MYSNILIPMDPDHADLFDAQVKAAQRLLADGGTISTIYVNQNYVHHVLAATSSDRPTEIEQAILKQVKALFEAEVPKEQRGHVYSRRGVVHDEIIKKAKAIKADLIIMAACKKPLERYFLGSNTRKVMMDASCSVFVQR
ncbi:Universal stress protein F [Marinobacterium lacunae]|uniref:Universal stress protein F n=1 Tax=Marinobacterium lacunae TaxID=1232683 RepID=A0A081G1I7_9GAMM|nr:universal stress protein [Marinobacterium lacunae]KEA64642.1 Universal stress protein F [Marinobacterium lacunae]MBR9882514.1 universal stress protein [Oceanospirillales bacterium]